MLEVRVLIIVLGLLKLDDLSPSIDFFFFEIMKGELSASVLCSHKKKNSPHHHIVIDFRVGAATCIHRNIKKFNNFTCTTLKVKMTFCYFNFINTKRYKI